MPKLSKEAKQRLQQLFKGGQFAIRWGFIPVVLYLGFKRGADPGMPEPTIWRYVSVPNVHANSVQVVTVLGVTSGQQQLKRLLPSIVFNCSE
uniref:Mitochondrial import receptor subunit TOM7 homolog n=1 Tax=Strix occidentalis caurina TaxID=311401 RepID=A0A8D0EHP6_STROC